MSDLVGRLLAFVPTRRAAILLFVMAFAVFSFQAVGWPMAKGRDTWDYLVYYLQLLDSDPPLSQVQLFRTPLTPLAVGLPLDLGGTLGLEIFFGLLYATSVVAWSGTAPTFGRVPALATALLLLAYPSWATLYHQASSDAVFATGLAVWALVLARVLRRPTTIGFVVLGVSIDSPNELDEVRATASRLEIDFPSLLDQETRVVSLYNPKTSAPYSVLIGRDGRVIRKEQDGLLLILDQRKLVGESREEARKMLMDAAERLK